MWVLKRMTAAGCGPDVDSVNTLMSAAVADDDPEAALGLWRRLRELGLQPDGRTYTALIQVPRYQRPASYGAPPCTSVATGRDACALLDLASNVCG
jgi:pentatricopeptide repeat protein